MKKKCQASIVKSTVVSLLFFIGLFAVIFFIQLNTTKLVNEDKGTISSYSLCVETADKVNHDSERPTNEARAFILGKGMEHFNNYIEQLNQKINGGSAIEKLKKANAHSKAIDSLKKALYVSDILSEQEMLAMALAYKAGIYNKANAPDELSNYNIPTEYLSIKREEQLKATNNLLFGTEYNNLKNQMVKDIQNCTKRAATVYSNQRTESTKNYNKLKTARNIIYFVMLLLVVGYFTLILQKLKDKSKKVMPLLKEDKPKQKGKHKRYNVLVGAYNEVREKLHAELQQAEILADELELGMKATSRYISTYDIINKKYTIHGNIAKEINIGTTYDNMPFDFLTAVSPLVDEENKEKFIYLYNLILSGCPNKEIDIKIKNKDDIDIWVRCSYHAIFDESSKPIKAIITITNITSEKKLVFCYDEYIKLLETRILSSKGAFVWIDVTNQKLLKFSQHINNEFKKIPSKNLEELFEQFDAFKVLTQNGETMRNALNKKALLNYFETGNREIINNCQGRGPDGTTIKIEMRTFLILNPATRNIEAAVQIYDQNKEDYLKNSPLKNILFIQKPGRDRDAIIAALKTTYSVDVVDTYTYGKALLEMKSGYGLILLDIGEADEKTYEFIRQTSKIRCITPILAFTDGSGSQELNAFKAGVEDTQSKPINISLLRHRIENILAKRDALLIIRNEITHRDELTGLLERGTFITLGNEMANNYSDGTNVAMLCIDVAGFKIINTRYGHHKGDDILRAIGDSIKHAIEGTLSVAMRSRSDRFYVLVPNDKSLIHEICNGIESIDCGLSNKIFVSIGIFQPKVAESVESMMSKALLAMESTRQTRTQNIAYFDEKMLETLMFNQRIIEDFHTGMEENQIVCYFQPKYDYEKKFYIGAEALVRWNHPSLGLLSPKQFIPLFERVGLITELDLYLLERICKKQRELKDEGYNTLQISVNLSPVDFSYPNLADKVLAIVEKYNLQGKDIRFEITETSYVNDAILLKSFIYKVHQKGFFVDMDDFGRGYSCLNMLSELNVDLLKLEMRMTANNENSKHEHILGAVIRMAKWLNIDVIAEGIETESQAEYLYNLGCCYMQGYYFSKPLPIDEFKELLIENDKKINNAMLLEEGKRSNNLTPCTKKQPNDLDAFLKNVAIIFPHMVAQNYSKNAYYIIEYDSPSTKLLKAKQLYDDFINVCAASYHPEENKGFASAFNRKNILELFSKGQNRITHIGRQMGCDGEYHWVRTVVMVYEDDDGDIKGYTVSQNVDEMQQQKILTDGVLEAFAEVYDVAYQIDIDGKQCYELKSNSQLRKIIPEGSDVKEVINKFVTYCVAADYQGKMFKFINLETLNQKLAGKKKISTEYKGKLSHSWLRASIIPIVYEDSGRIKQFIFGVTVIENERLAKFDGVTGLFNSTTAQKKIERVFQKGKQDGGALLVIDIDDLKSINDNNGHPAGTDVICGVANCLKENFYSNCIIGRYGGDEFIVFIKDYEYNKKQLAEKLEKLLSEISSKNFIKNCDCTITCSIGVSFVSDNTKDFNKLFNQADYALYNAKRENKNKFKFFEEN